MNAPVLHLILRRGLFLFILVSLPVLFLAPSDSYSGEKKNPEFLLKWATIAPENTTWGDIIHQFTEDLEAQAGGRLKNIWYFGAIMGDEPDTVRKLRLNQLQGLALLSVGLSKLASELMVFSLPFLFRNYDEVDCVFAHAWESIEKILQEKGFKVFGQTDIGFSVMFTTKNLRTQEDFGQSAAWTWSGLDADLPAAKLYGIKNLVPLPLPDVLPALQTGMVDVVYATYYTATALQWHTEVKYMTNPGKFGGGYAPAMLIMRKDIYDSLPPDIQRALGGINDKYFPILKQSARSDEENTRKALLKRGIKPLQIDPDLMKKAESLAPTIHRQLIGTHFPAWFYDEIIATRDRCRAELNR